MKLKAKTDEIYRAKLFIVMLIGCALTALIFCGWAVYFAKIGNLVGLSFYTANVVIAIISYWQSSRHNMWFVTYVGLPLVLISLCFICVYVDTPTSFGMRSSHMYLLPGALFIYLLYENKNRYLRVALIAATLITFCFFASSTFGRAATYPSAEFRSIAAWINNGFVIILLCIGVYVLQAGYVVRHKLELDFSKAIINKEFSLYFQPQVDDRGYIVGSEALVRWSHGTLGLIMPDEFIPMAEKTGLILLLGAQVLDLACYQLVNWSKHANTANLTLSVNVSAIQLKNINFVHDVVESITKAKADAKKLKLELTESIFVQDIEEVALKMTTLISHGVQFSLDDFGTGYSSLAYLKRLPLYELKIDRAFVKNILNDNQDAIISKIIITLAHELHIDVIAEGVEAIEQQQFLSKNGCHLFQGYLYGAPLPIDDFNALVSANHQLRLH